MIKLSSALTLETDDTSAAVKVTHVDELIFAVQGNITAGTVDVQYLADEASGTAWVALDSTNLSFTAAGTAVADWGECQIRFIGTGLTTDDAIQVWIGGTFVHTT